MDKRKGIQSVDKRKGVSVSDQQIQKLNLHIAAHGQERVAANIGVSRLTLYNVLLRKSGSKKTTEKILQYLKK